MCTKSDNPCAKLSKNGLKYLSYTSFIFANVSLIAFRIVPAISANVPSNPSNTVLNSSLLSLIGCTIQLSKSLPNLPPNSNKSNVVLTNIPIIFAVSRCPFSLPNASNIYAIVSQASPINKAISPVISNMDISFCLIKSLFSSR